LLSIVKQGLKFLEGLAD
jgi:hypothetical protein